MSRPLDWKIEAREIAGTNKGVKHNKVFIKCDAAWALKCSPANVHTGVIESFFRSGA